MKLPVFEGAVEALERHNERRKRRLEPVNQKKGKGRSDSKGKCAACGSSTHQHSSHRDCPFHKDRAKKEALSVSPSERSTRAASESGNESLDGPSDSGMSDEVEIDICTCGAEGRAHKRGCPLSLRNRKPGCALFPACDSGAAAAPGVPCSPERHTPAPVEVVKGSARTQGSVGGNSSFSLLMVSTYCLRLRLL